MGPRSHSSWESALGLECPASHRPSCLLRLCGLPSPSPSSGLSERILAVQFGWVVEHFIQFTLKVLILIFLIFPLIMSV